jgi:iron complex outermembrane receptor protein
MLGFELRRTGASPLRMPTWPRPYFLRRSCIVGWWLLPAMLCAQSVSSGHLSGKAPARAEEEPVKMEQFHVSAKPGDEGFDATGMGSYENQLRDPLFSNDLISVEALEDDPLAIELKTELGLIATPSAVDLATGDSRVGLRGFPTPLLSNGFVRMGGIDVLNTARTIVIQGALVPVLGRGAPGGIQDFWTNRPRATRGRRIDFAVSSLERQAAVVEVNDPLIPKRAWHRIAADWSRKTGPETFTASETRSVNGALTWRHGAAASSLFSVDYAQTRATLAPAIPEYREASGGKIVGPYLPLAGFNALGPEAGIRRRSVVANFILDAQPHPKIALRAGLEAWWRRIEQDRFTTGLLNLATARFEGIREPLHSEQPQHASVVRVEATGRFAALGVEHKLLLAASHTVGDFLREERALPVALRNALPAGLRNFDPVAPDYSRPSFSRDLYNRILTDRTERTRYTAIELTERIGFARGRTVITAGLREDLVGLELSDRRIGLPPAQARVSDAVSELSYHLGINYQLRPGRVLLFATTSTAFNPSTRVDLRTGKIQGNETTRGCEGGWKARSADQRLELTASAFSFVNQDISRRNPLYGDPVHDANHTQPQLVAAGEEQFTGGKLEGRWKLAPPLAFSLSARHVRAITTASPDLPEEIGRALTRFPPYSMGATATYAFGPGRWTGLSLSGSWTYFSAFVAAYEDRYRNQLEYPGYGLAALSASYSLRRDGRTHGFGLAVRNLFDADLLRKLARLGAGREISASYRLMW